MRRPLSWSSPSRRRWRLSRAAIVLSTSSRIPLVSTSSTTPGFASITVAGTGQASITNHGFPSPLDWSRWPLWEFRPNTL